MVSNSYIRQINAHVSEWNDKLNDVNSDANGTQSTGFNQRR